MNKIKFKNASKDAWLNSEQGVEVSDTTKA